MFTVQQQVLLQVATAAVIVFFVCLIGGTGILDALVWGLVLALGLFLLLRQNIIVAGGGDVARPDFEERPAPTGPADVGTSEPPAERDAEVGSTSAAPAATAPAPVDPATTEPDAAVQAAEDPAAEAPASSAGSDTDPADDLKRIKGIGPKLEAELNAQGIRQYRQIAAWSPEDVARADEELTGVRGAASRDDWVGQAKALLEDT